MVKLKTFCLQLFFTLLFTAIIFSQDIKVNFYEKASKVKSIKITNKILIGDINFLDIDKNGNILITDRIGNAVHILDREGKLLRTLTPDSCNPGFNWRPFKAYYDRHGDILVLNSIPWGYRFWGNGNCKGEMDITFIAPLHIYSLSDNSIVGYYNLDDGLHLKMMNDKGKEKFRFGEFPSEYERLIYRFEGGGLVTDKDDNIYQLNFSSPEIFKYDKRGKLTQKFGKIPSYFRKIERDLSSSDPKSAFSEIPKLLKDKTIALSLFEYDTDKIMVQLYNGNFYGIQIYNLKGDYLLKDEIILDRQILSAKYGLIYFVYQPEPDANGNLPNPVLEVYKLK